jgi:hypothetical protein
MATTEIISPKNVEIFRESLQRIVNEVDLSKLGYIGLIGTGLATGEPVSDIDVLILPNPEYRIGESIIAMNGLYQELDKILQSDYGLYLAPFPRKMYQDEVNYIIGENKGIANKIATHTLFFPDLPSFLSINPAGFMRSINENSYALFGDLDTLMKLDPKSQKTLDPYFMITDFNVQLFEGKYPDELILQKGTHLLKYLNKFYGVPGVVPIIRTSRDCVRAVDDTLLELDALVA